ncbi:MAG TPA: RagB/SusD family nutrient uptake outer membrane protein, partial [Puia sp.]|nr:RagB/SusD family nutrient uptake outer membrane protein [Puia sp.]
MKRVRRRRVAFYLLLMTTGNLLGCGKSPFLDKKPDTRLVVPTTLNDFQTLMDNQYIMQETPELGELSADNFYTTYSVWQGLVVKEQNAYTWAQDIYDGIGQVPDWDIPYQQVFYANVVLDGLVNIKPDETNQVQWNTIKGTALFLRAYAFHNLSQVFAPLYDSTSAASDNGIPLRLIADVNKPSTRASVQATYEQILTDLQEAVGLLPDPVPTNNLNRPSKPAALALLARVCLSMRAYNLAGSYANNCLQMYNTLIGYDTVHFTKTFPIYNSNPETLYQSVMYRSSGLFVGGGLRSNLIVDSNLYASYAPGDLRKNVFYRTSNGLAYLKGSYNGSSYCFSGLATDEVYLIRAECAARGGDKAAALNDLNNLLQHRWADSVAFNPVTALNADDALDSILVERR